MRVQKSSGTSETGLVGFSRTSPWSDPTIGEELLRARPLATDASGIQPIVRGDSGQPNAARRSRVLNNLHHYELNNINSLNIILYINVCNSNEERLIVNILQLTEAYN